MSKIVRNKNILNITKASIRVKGRGCGETEREERRGDDDRGDNERDRNMEKRSLRKRVRSKRFQENCNSR